MKKEFHQSVWDSRIESDLQALVQLALREDLGIVGDLTSCSLIGTDTQGQADVVSRQSGIVAGLMTIPTILAAVDSKLHWTTKAEDGQAVVRGQCVGVITGPARSLLAAERLVLNFLGRLSGIATLTRRYVDAVAGLKVGIYDTRKTTPGWRRLEKYAVHCGGGRNHRCGLDEAILIKDNHLALGAQSAEASKRFTPAEAVLRAREYAAKHWDAPDTIVEVEVDTLEQLAMVLEVKPDIVLLDNMNAEQLREAVAMRNRTAKAVELEASGGVNLDTIRQPAEAGVDRISIGALTHSAVSLDFGLDWAIDIRKSSEPVI